MLLPAIPVNRTIPPFLPKADGPLTTTLRTFQLMVVWVSERIRQTYFCPWSVGVAILVLAP